MSLRTIRALGVLLLTLTVAAPALAVDKEQRQLMADVRMLQEQNQQLQNLLGSIAEAIKAVNARLDDQASTTRKALADQKLVIDNLTNDVRVIREKLDDNNVRLGSLSQEVDALRQGVQQLNSRSAPGDSSAAAPEGGAPVPAAAPVIAIGTSPEQLWTSAYSDYTLGQWDLAISGFDYIIKSFPRAPRAADAQVYIGHSYMAAGKNDKAVEAYDLAIRNYPGAPALPDAYYRKGLALRNLKQLDRAREAFDYVVKTYPQSAAASLAQQQLAQPGR